MRHNRSLLRFVLPLVFCGALLAGSPTSARAEACVGAGTGEPESGGAPAELLAALPAFREPTWSGLDSPRITSWSSHPPFAATSWRQWQRLWGGAGGAAVWVVPTQACTDELQDCVFANRGVRGLTATCASPSEIADGKAWTTAPLSGGRTLVLGIAPRSATAAAVGSAVVGLRDGVLAADVAGPVADVKFRTAPHAAPATASLALMDEAGGHTSATAVARRVGSRDAVVLGRATAHRRERTTLAYSSGSARLARQMARTLKIATPRPLRGGERSLAQTGRVIAFLGRDLSRHFPARTNRQTHS